MVAIFTKTSSQLSLEFVALIAADKLAMSLVRIRDETGVEVSQADQTFSIRGQWTDVVKAHKCLESTFSSELLQNVNESDSEMSTKVDWISGAVKVTTPRITVARGRKPGSSISRIKSVLPSPRVECVQNESISHTREKDMLTAQLYLHQLNYVNKSGELVNRHGEPISRLSVGEESIDAPSTDPTVNKDQRIKQEHTAIKLENIEVFEYTLSNKEDNIASNSQSEQNVDTDSQRYVEANVSSNDGEEHFEDNTVDDEAEDEEKDYVPSSSDTDEYTNVKEKVKPKKKKGKTKIKTKPVKVKTESNIGDDGNSVFRCDQCEYLGKKKSNLKEHKKRMHRHRFTCEQCDKKFGIRKDYRRHVNTVHLEPAYSCKVCDRQYKNKRVFDDHLQTHSENYVKPNFCCQMCDKSFSTKYVLTSHIKSEHLGIKKSYLCPTCGRSFTQKQSYLLHANVHAGVKPFKCDICGKAFTYEKSLREHKYMHESVRRFECDVCKKTFKQSTSLRTHMKTHQDQKDYICPICGKGFSQKQALDRHERIHSGEKPFTCSLCSKTFTDSSIIRRHMILLHKRDPKEWRNGVVSKVRHKKDFYIEGLPEHHISKKGLTSVSDDQKQRHSAESDIDETTMDYDSVTNEDSNTKLNKNYESDATLTKVKDEPFTGPSGASSSPGAQQGKTPTTGQSLNSSTTGTVHDTHSLTAPIVGPAVFVGPGHAPSGHTQPPPTGAGSAAPQQHWESSGYPAYYSYQNYQQFQGPQN